MTRPSRVVIEHDGTEREFSTVLSWLDWWGTPGNAARVAHIIHPNGSYADLDTPTPVAALRRTPRLADQPDRERVA